MQAMNAYSYQSFAASLIQLRWYVVLFICTMTKVTETMKYWGWAKYQYCKVVKKTFEDVMEWTLTIHLLLFLWNEFYLFQRTIFHLIFYLILLTLL